MVEFFALFKNFFFEYKYIFLYAHQKQHITSKISFIVTLTQFTIEIFLLLIFKNFLLYLVVVISANIIKGIWISKVFNNIFKSLISIKLTQLDKLPIQEKSNINKSIKNLFILKLGARMGDSTDKIIISQLLGISMVGLYSNYLFLSGLASALLGVIRSSFQPILGKIFHSHDNESKKLIFNGIQIFNFVIVFNASFAFQSLIIPFIKLWIGDFYLLDNLVPLAMSINFFAINSIIVFLMVYEVLGLFNYGKWLNLYGAIINIILSIFLGNYFGITGILFATSISQLLTVVFYIPNLINKIILNVSSIGFIKTYLFLLFILILLFFVNQYILTITLLSHYILILFLEVIIINAILFIIFNKLPEFHWLKNYLSNFISRKKTIHN
jgi:O-antigen/teichoic acid export membrane protein